MKKILAVLGLLLSAVCLAQVSPGFVPGQVLSAAQLNAAFAQAAAVTSGTLTSPTITGGTITGATITSGTVSLASLAAQAANTVVANATASSASPTAFAMPSCSAATSALGWTTSTGFTCNSAINAASLAGQTFTSPTITTPTITGGTSGACAATGNIGECKNSNIPVGSAVPLTTSTAATITSVSLTAGNWLCYGNVIYVPTGSTVAAAEGAFLNTVPAAAPTAPNANGYSYMTALSNAVGQASDGVPVGPMMQNVTSPTTVYLIAYASFSASTLSAYGYINCVRWH